MSGGFEFIGFTVEQGVATITLNRPGKLNSFNEAMHGELRQALARVRDSAQVKVLILTGAGRAFCAGQDLGERRVPPGGTPVDLGDSIERNYTPLVLGLRALPKPVIGAVNGVAAGAGANVALACDVVVAARSASFVQPFARLGLVPDCGGTHFLVRRLGTQRALGLSLFGDSLSAELAEQWGLIWKCVDDDALSDTVRQMARQLAAGPALGYAHTKAAVYAAEQNALAAQLELERDYQRQLGFSHDYREGVAAFLERRPPNFTGA